MNKLHTSAAPHINSGATTHKVMRDVAIALLPATIAAVVLFGLEALWIVLVCVGSAVLAEFLFNLVLKKKQTIFDFSAVVTGLILALNLSTKVPLWICAIGSVFAIIVVKCLFGGLGKNIVNPAIGARVFLLLAFGTFVTGGANTVFELTSAATPLGGEGVIATGDYNLLTLLIGNHGGTIGETCAIALLLGYVYLVARGHIKWYVPFAFVATVFVLFFVTTWDLGYATAQVLAGGLLLGAIFMATDYVTTPISKLGKVVFCIGCGVITYVIRMQYFGFDGLATYPEGVSIAILVMNLLTPLIEKWTNPRTLGGVK
jgi:electron transport complex protein RnfD